jgi:hypothetical protein
MMGNSQQRRSDYPESIWVTDYPKSVSGLVLNTTAIQKCRNVVEFFPQLGMRDFGKTAAKFCLKNEQ